MTQIPNQYDPKNVERKHYEKWMNHKYFSTKVDKNKKPYTIVIPPPNVTGVLHMGHILNNTLQDILIRWKRMQGFNAEWLPGTDHAAIATQNVLEKQLKKKGQTKEDLGREEFDQLFWEWKEKSGGTIIKQLQHLGASCDWDREAFTMDENLSKAVGEVFIRLFNKGYVYRGKYIINWCPRCQTALSDDETEYSDKKSHLWHLKYHLKDDPSKFLVVATTRPETMLGDTAVAVNPKDQRYQDFVGKTLVLPLVEREIPVITDDFVDAEFGTGCVKVTPAHDPNDFQMGLRHDLEKVVVIGPDGIMNENAIHFNGMDRFACRKQLISELEEKGFLAKIEDHDHNVGQCYRCDTVIEPYLSDQWFVKMKPLAEPVIKAIENDEIVFYPERWKKVALNWLYGIHDWCISRQIWLGHRIPIWYCENGHTTASLENPGKCSECGSKELRQDADVLDTWFSSWLWPFSTFGWPEQTEDLKYFYPTDTLVTDPGILFFWVIRMCMAGFEFMGEKPFSKVHLHGVVCDEKGRKMSKSLGNSPDPLDIIDRYSADAMRFSIIFNTPPGQNTLYSEKQTEMGRNYTNKIWNAFRLILMNIEDFDLAKFQFDKNKLTLADCWILNQLNQTTQEMDRYLEEFRFNEAAHSIYDFTWKNLCDWYLEISKLRWNQQEDQYDKDLASYLTLYCLESSIKLLHPIMPFLSEEIWQILKEKKLNILDPELDSVMFASFPHSDESWQFPKETKEMEFLMEMISQIRNVRAEKGIKPKDKINLVLLEKNAIIENNQEIIKKLAQVENISISNQKVENCATAVVQNVEIFIPLEGLLDLDAEKKKIEKEKKQLESYLAGLNKKLSNEKFVSNAPQDVVESEKQRYAELDAKLQTLKASLEKLSN